MTASEKIYDILMRLPYAAFQSYFLVREISGIRKLVAFHPYAGGDWSFLMTLAARVSVVVFHPCRNQRTSVCTAFPRWQGGE